MTTPFYRPQPQPSGEVYVRVSDGEAGPVINRYILAPGKFTDATTWVAANIGAEPQHVQDACAAHWTQAVVDAFKATHPYVAPPAPKTDQDLLNDALVAPGSVVRALGLVMFAEINKLRVKNGDPAYTLAQFKAALVAQMS